MTEKKVILIIDDSITNNIMIKTLLQRYEYRVLTAFSGKEALVILESEIPDVILLDIMMPQMSGYQVLENIMADPCTQNIPVIIVSAKKDIQAIDKAMKLGAFDYITKPVTRNAFLEKVELAIHSH